MELGKCPKCNDTGIVKDEGGVHVCWDCLQGGKLDGYSKNVPVPRIEED